MGWDVSWTVTDGRGYLGLPRPTITAFPTAYSSIRGSLVSLSTTNRYPRCALPPIYSQSFLFTIASPSACS